MINLRKPLKIKVKFFFSIYVLFLSTFCSEEKNNFEFLARVNDSFLTREDVASLVDTAKLDDSQLNLLIKEWAKKELLFQKAIDEGIIDDQIYEDILLKSSRELAISLFIQKKFNEFEFEIKEDDLINFYNVNKVLFQKSDKTYQINIAVFSDEELAIKFRELAIESQWQRAIQFISDKPFFKGVNNNLILESWEIYPNEIVRLADNMMEKEISIVIKDLKNNYYVFQLEKIFKPFEIYPFELVKELVKEKYILQKKIEMFENFLSELYSENKVEIKKWIEK
jgi:hypothetical protein